jgi:hypothetical protein
MACALVLVLAACASSSTRGADSLNPSDPTSIDSTREATLRELRARPLDLPSVTEEGACPVAGVSSAPSADLGTMWGEGPVRPVLGPAPQIGIAPAENFDSAVWGGGKVLWAMSADTSGVALIRGRQLDGATEARFDGGATPAAEKVLDPNGREALDGGWYDFPGFVRLRDPGCDGFQIDIADDSFVIVLEAA